MSRNIGMMIGLLGLLCALSLGASAQEKHGHFSQKSAPPSASGVEPKSGATAVPVSQPQLADAMLASTLGYLQEQTDDHFHQGEFNHIINLSRIIVEGDPHNVIAFENAAYLLWSTDRNAQAIELLKQGLAKNKSNYYMYDELGNHYWVRLRDPETAQRYYVEAVKFACPAFTWHSLANCFEKTGQWERAVKAWEKAANYPNNPQAKVRLQRAKTRLANVQRERP